jgi:hypothetical protein
MKIFIIRLMLVLFLSAALGSGLVSANNNRVILKTDVVETLLVPKSTESLSWERVSPKSVAMPKKIERNGAKGCAIFSFNINEQGATTDIKTEAVVPSFGLRRLAKEYLESWQWEAKPSGGIEESVLLRLDFCIGGATNQEAQDICKHQASLPCTR